MKEKQCHPKTIAAQVIMFLVRNKGDWCTWGPAYYMPSVQGVLPVGTSEKLQHRYMAMLQRKGLVGGCDCGCRGDYAVTLKGLEFLAQECSYGEQDAKEYIREKYPLRY